MSKRVRRSVLAAVAVTLATQLSPMPSASAANDCRLFADDPFWDGSGYLIGSGGRVGCVSTTRTVTVLLRQDVPWWSDRTLAEVTKTGMTVLLDAKKYCAGGDDDMWVYTETRNNTGGKVQSGRILTSC